MSLNPLATIEKVEQFLREEVSGAVSPELRSEVKAAAKLLNESVRELDGLSAVLRGECEAIADLCRQAQHLSIESPTTELSIPSAELTQWGDLGLKQQLEIHRQWQAYFSHLIGLLDIASREGGGESEDATTLLHQCLVLQTRFSEKKVPLQSVFI
jgi:hypothetical protein